MVRSDCSHRVGRDKRAAAGTREQTTGLDVQPDANDPTDLR
jgi:hypothetical protein